MMAKIQLARRHIIGRMEETMQWIKPKSVRQIGDVPGRDRVYMEDYVLRFARRLTNQGRGEERAAMLLGGVYTYNNEKIYQISGIVEIPNFAQRSEPAFSQDTWNKIFTEIKENFTDLEIIGWFYSCKDFSVMDAPKLLEIHKQNFQHRDKVLYIYEESDKEDTFFLYKTGQLERQKGHFIYYEKNPEMLNYMEKESNRHVHIVEQEDDRVIRNIRGIMEEKEKRQQKKQQSDNRMGYKFGVVVAMIAILIGAATLKNQSTLNQMKDQVSRLQEMAQGTPSDSETTMVETMGSNLIRVTPASASGAALSTSESSVAK